MKTSVKFFALMAMVFAIGACDEMGVPSSPASDNLFQIEAVPAGDFTRATDTAFEDGDALSVSVFKGTLMEYWIGNGKFTKTANGFVADQNYYWYEGTDVCTIVGFYPYASYTAESILSEGINFCVKSDQSTHAGYTASDLMVSLSNNVAPTTDKVTLTFNHLLSKVVVDVKNETSSEIANVYFDGVQAYYSYSLLGSSIEGGAGTIKAGQLATPSEGYTNSFALIIPPQVVAPTLAITTVDGKEYKRPASEAIDFGSGKVRHLTATITEESVYIEFDAIVNDWSADEDVEFADQPNTGGDNPENPENPALQINPNWSATYIPEFYDEESGQTYKDLVEIVSTDENNGFFLEFISEDYYLENIAPDVKGYVNGVAEHLIEYLNDFNAEGGTDYDFTIYTYYKYGLYDMYWIMNPGKWRVAMWGMTTEGEVTGLYYISDMIEVIDPATPEYLSWLGTFVISEQGESTTTSTITITRNEVNESYWVSGWNNIENSIVAGFDPDGGWEGSSSLEFYAQTVLSDFYVGDTHIVDLYFGGLVTVGDALAPLVTAGDKLAQADWLGDTNSTFINHYTYSVDGEEAPVTQIGFLASLDDGGLTYITAEIHSIKTSLKMNRVENTEPAAVARKHNPLDVGNNGAARPLEEVRKVRKPQTSNYVVGGRKFNAVNF